MISLPWLKDQAAKRIAKLNQAFEDWHSATFIIGGKTGQVDLNLNEYTTGKIHVTWYFLDYETQVEEGGESFDLDKGGLYDTKG